MTSSPMHQRVLQRQHLRKMSQAAKEQQQNVGLWSNVLKRQVAVSVIMGILAMTVVDWWLNQGQGRGVQWQGMVETPSPSPSPHGSYYLAVKWTGIDWLGILTLWYLAIPRMRLSGKATVVWMCLTALMNLVLFTSLLSGLRVPGNVPGPGIVHHPSGGSMGDVSVLGGRGEGGSNVNGSFNNLGGSFRLHVHPWSYATIHPERYPICVPTTTPPPNSQGLPLAIQRPLHHDLTAGRNIHDDMVPTQQTLLPIYITGSGPWDLEYAMTDSRTQKRYLGRIKVEASPYLLPVKKPGIYELISVRDAKGILGRIVSAQHHQRQQRARKGGSPITTATTTTISSSKTTPSSTSKKSVSTSEKELEEEEASLQVHVDACPEMRFDARLLATATKPQRVCVGQSLQLPLWLRGGAMPLTGLVQRRFGDAESLLTIHASGEAEAADGPIVRDEKTGFLQRFLQTGSLHAPGQYLFKVASCRDGRNNSHVYTDASSSAKAMARPTDSTSSSAPLSWDRGDYVLVIVSAPPSVSFITPPAGHVSMTSDGPGKELELVLTGLPPFYVELQFTSPESDAGGHPFRLGPLLRNMDETTTTWSIDVGGKRILSRFRVSRIDSLDDDRSDDTAVAKGKESDMRHIRVVGKILVHAAGTYTLLHVMDSACQGGSVWSTPSPTVATARATTAADDETLTDMVEVDGQRLLRQPAKHPYSMVVVTLPRPSLEATFRPVRARCLGDIGAQVFLHLQGTPPFRVVFRETLLALDEEEGGQVKGLRTLSPRVRTKEITITSFRHVYTWQPEETGKYQLSIVSLADHHYPEPQPLDGSLMFEQHVHPKSTVTFLPFPRRHGGGGGGNAYLTYQCLSEHVDLRLGLTGSAPWTVTMDMVQPPLAPHQAANASGSTAMMSAEAKTTFTLTNITESPFTVSRPSLPRTGMYSYSLTSVTDRHGCTVVMAEGGQGPPPHHEAMVEVFSVPPSVQFMDARRTPLVSNGDGHENNDDDVDGRGMVALKIGDTARLPLHLTGEAPWTLRFDYEAEGGDPASPRLAHNEKTLWDANAVLTVDAPGTYRLISLRDKYCPGRVVNTTVMAYERTLVSVARPTARIVDRSGAKRSLCSPHPAIPPHLPAPASSPAATYGQTSRHGTHKPLSHVTGEEAVLMATGAAARKDGKKGGGVGRSPYIPIKVQVTGQGPWRIAYRLRYSQDVDLTQVTDEALSSSHRLGRSSTIFFKEHEVIAVNSQKGAGHKGNASETDFVEVPFPVAGAPGYYHMELMSVTDVNYRAVPITKTADRDAYIVTQVVLPNPQAYFTNNEQKKFQCQGPLLPQNLPELRLEGQAPFSLDYRLTGPELSKEAGKEGMVMSMVMEEGYLRQSTLPLPNDLSLNTTGAYLFSLDRLTDATGCTWTAPQRRPYDTNGPEMEMETLVEDRDGDVPMDHDLAHFAVHVIHTPAITALHARSVVDATTTSPLASYYCVGDYVQFRLGGTGPWSVKYEFIRHTGPPQQRRQEAPEQHAQTLTHTNYFTLYAAEPGALRVVSVCNKYCCTADQDLPSPFIIHALPKALLDHGQHTERDIREGDVATMKIFLTGEPPFDVTYQRTLDTTSVDGFFETIHVKDIYEHILSIDAMEEGIFHVTSVKDRFCSYPRAESTVE